MIHVVGTWHAWRVALVRASPMKLVEVSYDESHGCMHIEMYVDMFQRHIMIIVCFQKWNVAGDRLGNGHGHGVTFALWTRSVTHFVT